MTCRVSVSSEGRQANGGSGLPVLSGSGRYVMFTSSASNLVSGDINVTEDVFLRNRQDGSTVRIGVSTTGVQADGPNYGQDITDDGRYALFSSYATNLVPGDTNGVQDVFLRDLHLGTTERVSVASGGGQADDHSDWAAISAGGRYVAFTSQASNLVPADGNAAADVFVRDRVAGTTSLITVSLTAAAGNGASDDPDISDDGRYVVFWSFASDLVRGDTNGAGDIFVRDLATGVTERVSVSSAGAQADNAAHRHVISGDGRYVAFSSMATNMVAGDVNGVDDVFRHDRLTGATTLASVSTRGNQVTVPTGNTAISISADGAHVAFSSEDVRLVPGDTNGDEDVFVHSTTRAWPCKPR